MRLQVPLKPLSVNRAFQGRRFKTPDCEDYERDLWRLLPQQKCIEGEVEMWLDFSLVNYSRTDISNLVKVLEDILVKKGYIEDDRKVVRLHLSKKRSEVDAIEIKIEALQTNEKTAL